MELSNDKKDLENMGYLQERKKRPHTAKALNLNQVTPIDLGYLPSLAMKDLVQDPTADVLQFEEQAVARVTYWSACNPFYANRICNQLWNFMTEQKWRFVKITLFQGDLKLLYSIQITLILFY